MTTSEETAEQPPVLTIGCRILRSPSHESVTTELSLFSVSSLASERAARLLSFKPGARVPSPNPDTKVNARPADIPEVVWFEEENELIRSCAALSSALGLQKSFSTSDISQLCPPEESLLTVRIAVSEVALNNLHKSGYPARLEHASRSCSTWVAVGDVASTSQLPSPHGGHSTTAQHPPQPPSFTPADLIRSVNKKVRQNYIRRRLLMTYKALERLSQSEFNLDRLEVAAKAAQVGQDQSCHLTVPGTSPAQVSSLVKEVKQRSMPLTVTDVERERGRPLSKYDRNMMIFNWLHTLDDSTFEGVQ